MYTILVWINLYNFKPKYPNQKIILKDINNITEKVK